LDLGALQQQVARFRGSQLLIRVSGEKRGGDPQRSVREVPDFPVYTDELEVSP
jgi:hypothetical protein